MVPSELPAPGVLPPFAVHARAILPGRLFQICRHRATRRVDVEIFPHGRCPARRRWHLRSVARRVSLRPPLVTNAFAEHDYFFGYSPLSAHLRSEDKHLELFLLSRSSRRQHVVDYASAAAIWGRSKNRGHPYLYPRGILTKADYRQRRMN